MRRAAVPVLALLLLATHATLISAQVIDRSKRPVVPPAPQFTFPAVQSRTLPNGLVVRVVENHALPLVAVRAFIEGGALLEPPGKEGLFALDTLLARDGTTSKSAEQLAAALDELGAPVLPTRFTSITAEFERALSLMGDMLMHPSFPQSAVDRRKTTLATSLRTDEGVARIPALRILNVQLWGATHPFARVATPATIEAITRDDVVRFHTANVRPQNVTVTIVGDVTVATAMSVVTKVFGVWEKSGERVSVTVPAAAPPKPTTIYLFDRPGSQQSTIFVGQTAPSRSTPDFHALELMGALFGGPTGSRLTTALREQRPLTYSVLHLPTWRRVDQPSSFYGSANVDAMKTDSALKVWLDQLRDLAGGRPPTESELAFGRSVTVGSLLTRIETIDEVANRLNLVARDGLPPDYYNAYVRGINRVTVAQVAAAATRTIDLSHTVIVVVADRAVVEPRLRAANLAPVVVVP